MRLIVTITILLLNIVIVRSMGSFFEKKVHLRGFKNMVVMSPFSIGLAVIYIYITGLNPDEAGLSFGEALPGLLSIVLLGIPAVVLSAIALFHTDESEIRKIRFGISLKSKYQFIYAWFLVGPVEELMYRGFLQGNLQNLFEGEIFTIGYATIISSLVFTLIHAFNVLTRQETWIQYLQQIPGRLLISLILGYSFQISRSLIYPIIIHNLIDGINMTIIVYRKKKAFEKDWKSNIQL